MTAIALARFSVFVRSSGINLIYNHSRDISPVTHTRPVRAINDQREERYTRVFGSGGRSSANVRESVTFPPVVWAECFSAIQHSAKKNRPHLTATTHYSSASRLRDRFRGASVFVRARSRNKCVLIETNEI